MVKQSTKVKRVPREGGEGWHLARVPVPLDLGEFEPDIAHVGRAVVVFKDMPIAGKAGIVSPRHIGTETGTKQGYTKTLEPRTEYGGGYIHPRSRKMIINSLVKAKVRLDAKRLGKLFRGTFIVRPKAQGGENQYGKEFGVGGRYYRQGDYIVIYSDVRQDWEVVKLIIHEIGHRYYYKHLTSQDRRNFDKWFRTVKAVSVYGATHPAEDFAEAFAWYVLNKELTPSQKARFKTFMTGYRARTENKPDEKESRSALMEGCSSTLRMQNALEPVPDFAYDQASPGDLFGRRVDERRRASALGQVGDRPTGSNKVKDAPASLLKMLGSDWDHLYADREHENRISLRIDGVHYTVYTRKG